MAVRAIEVVRRTDVAIIAANRVEDQVVRSVIVRRSRPIAASVADLSERTIAVIATTQNRIPDGGSTAEHAGEVHTFVRVVVGVGKR